jgi:hypothetical protein
MPVTYPITLPTSPTSRIITLRKRSVGALGVSPFSLVSQAQISGGQQWAGTVTLPPMMRASAEPWVSALISLNGIEGSFLAGDTANLTPRGIGTGTPLVNGGSQTGYDLVTDGWTAGQTGIMKAGDWLQLGSGSTSRLYKVMVDANSDGSGNATLTLWPKLRSSPANNAAITVNSPKGRFMLAEEVEWSINEAKVYEGLSFEIVEDLRP